MSTLQRLSSGALPAKRPSICRRRLKIVVQQASSGQVLREVLRRNERIKLDPTSDRQFYGYPRLVKHVDDSFLRQVTQLYRERIPEGGAVLDLMSSWISHLPPSVRYRRVIGHGMNAAELARNPQLDEFFVRDLNQEPDGWALEDNSLDAVLCCVSVQYMEQPERVFAEIHRVLRPRGVVILTWSNRMFYTKAIAAWRDGTEYSRCQLVKSYVNAIDGFSAPELLRERKAPPAASSSTAASPASPFSGLWEGVSKLFASGPADPFYAVVAVKQ